LTKALRLVWIIQQRKDCGAKGLYVVVLHHKACFSRPR